MRHYRTRILARSRTRKKVTAPATRTATADSTSTEPILYPHVAKLQPSAGGMYGLGLVSPIQFVLEDRDRVVRVQGQRTEADDSGPTIH